MEQDVIVIKDSLKIYVEKSNEMEGLVILSLKGFLDTYNSSDFQREVMKLIEEDFVKLLFNCSELSYVSSTGVGAFTAFLKIIKEKQGEIILANLQEKVLEVFQLLGFSKFFTIVPSIEEAKKMFFPKAKETPEVPKTQPAVFPKIFQCPACNKSLKASSAGKFRCAKCKAVLIVNEKGNVSLG